LRITEVTGFGDGERRGLRVTCKENGPIEVESWQQFEEELDPAALGFV